jgi:putative NADH-flavin reductase
MNVALIGFSGRVGSRVFAELLARGHTVTGIARRAAGARPGPGVAVRQADATDAAQLAPALAGHDAVISASNFVSSDPKALLAAVKRAGVGRLLVVGGAGSLEVAPGKFLIDATDFPDAYKPEARAGRDFLDALRAGRNLDWTSLSPSAEFEPGERTGKFRLGKDQLLAGAGGRSRISMEDYAIAPVDELE